MRRLVFLVVLLALLMPAVAYAAESDLVGAPTGLVLIGSEEKDIKAYWTNGDNATYTMLRLSPTESPATISDGILIYYGPANNTTATGYDLTYCTYYISAWGYGTDNNTYSNSHVSSSIGGYYPEVIRILGAKIDGINTNLNALNAYLSAKWSQALVILLTILLLVIALWQRDRVFYALSAFASMLYGFSIWSTAWYLSILIFGVGIYMFIMAFTRKRMAE